MYVIMQNSRSLKEAFDPFRIQFLIQINIFIFQWNNTEQDSEVFLRYWILLLCHQSPD